MQSLGDVMSKYKVPEVAEKSRVNHEFQSYGLYLAEQLNDMAHRGIYIRMAKQQPRSLLERALSFVSDSGATNKGALFMWKIKQLRAEKKNV